MSSLPACTVDFAFGSNPNTVGPTWTNVAAFGVKNFTTKRGRSFELDSFQPGTATITLDNRDGRYTPPGNSPYSGQMLLMVPVRITATVSAVTYNIWRGFVERIPVTWTDSGTRGVVQVNATDLISLLATITQDFGALGYEALLLPNYPRGFWPLDEAAGATTGRQTSNSGPAQLATVTRSPSGYVAPTFGTSLPGLVGSSGSPAGVTFHGLGATYQNGGGLSANIGTLNGPFTIECWVQIPGVTLTAGQAFGLVQLYDSSSPSTTPPGLTIVPAGSGGLTASSWGGASLGATYTGTVMDNALHQVVIAIGLAGEISLSVDGVQVGYTTDATASYDVDTLTIGCSINASGAKNILAGVIGSVALYNYGLSQTEVLNHYQAGLSAFSGDTTGTRITRLLTYCGYPLSTSIATGSSHMSPALLSSQTLQGSIQDAVSTERGRFFIAGDGTVTFLGRAAEYNQSTVATLGEDVAGGELPYSDITLSYDPDYLFNDITVTCPTGTAHVSDADSITQYGTRATSLTIESSSDTEARSLAQYLLVRFKQPMLRVASVTLRPDSNANLWPVCLGTEIGDVIGVNRRPANSPAITGQIYVVESIQHTEDSAAGTWQTVFELSPLISGVHYWKLEDGTYGQIDNPNILLSA